jgi:hypothetical protein
MLRFLATFATAITVGLLALGALRGALLAFGVPVAHVPPLRLLTFGGVFTAMTALIFVPAYVAWQERVSELRDALHPVPQDGRPPHDWFQARDDLDVLLSAKASVGRVPSHGIQRSSPAHGHRGLRAPFGQPVKRTAVSATCRSAGRSESALSASWPSYLPGMPTEERPLLHAIAARHTYLVNHALGNEWGITDWALRTTRRGRDLRINVRHPRAAADPEGDRRQAGCEPHLQAAYLDSGRVVGLGSLNRPERIVLCDAYRQFGWILHVRRRGYPGVTGPPVTAGLVGWGAWRRRWLHCHKRC